MHVGLDRSRSNFRLRLWVSYLVPGAFSSFSQHHHKLEIVTGPVSRVVIRSKCHSAYRGPSAVMLGEHLVRTAFQLVERSRWVIPALIVLPFFRTLPGVPRMVCPLFLVLLLLLVNYLWTRNPMPSSEGEGLSFRFVACPKAPSKS